MSDYISRETAIKAVCGGCNDMYEEDNAPCYPAICSIKHRLNAIPAADVVDGAAYRELLKVAKNMHLWIFNNTVDEKEAYDECELSDEMNALLGYGGQVIVDMDGGENDAVD